MKEKRNGGMMGKKRGRQTDGRTDRPQTDRRTDTQPKKKRSKRSETLLAHRLDSIRPSPVRLFFFISCIPPFSFLLWSRNRQTRVFFSLFFLPPFLPPFLSHSFSLRAFSLLPLDPAASALDRAAVHSTSFVHQIQPCIDRPPDPGSTLAWKSS